jgi:hypothetical protein
VGVTAVADAVELMLADLATEYAGTPTTDTFTRLYDDTDYGHLFAIFHERLNQHFESINGRARSTRHYWADSSRGMLALIRNLEAALDTWKAADMEVAFDAGYRAAVDRCKPWLAETQGSAVPEGFELIQVIKYRPVFTRPEAGVRLKKSLSEVKRTMVGEGSYAIVYSYTDPDYGKRFAIKRAKRGLDGRDLHRFRQEFETLKKLSFPYIVEVYRYDEDTNEYTMEYCDVTLRDYIRKRNSKLSPASRKRIALQFLYGINYIHHKGYLHRDVSLQNVMLKVFGDGAVLVKLSDFGLVKDAASGFTRTNTEMRGTIRDPMLSDFKDYAAVNEIFSIGFVLSYIFTGREGLKPGGDEIGKIVQKCAANDTADRYQSVMDLIADVESLAVSPTGAPA